MAKILNKYTISVNHTYKSAATVSTFNFLDNPDKYLQGANGLGVDCGVKEMEADEAVFPTVSVEELIRSPLVRRYVVSYTINNGQTTEERKRIKVLVARDLADAFETKYNGADSATATIYTEAAVRVKAQVDGVRKHLYI